MTLCEFEEFKAVEIFSFFQIIALLNTSLKTKKAKKKADPEKKGGEGDVGQKESAVVESSKEAKKAPAKESVQTTPKVVKPPAEQVKQ